MTSYLLLFKGSFAKWNALSEERRSDIIKKFGNYGKELGNLGYMRGGAGCGERSFRLLKREATAENALVNNNTEDMVTGYFIIEVPSEAEALRVARLCPAFDYGEHIELIPCSHD
jgi:hypothetical protein